MWQRFTERARRVVFFAQEEASKLGDNFVSTEHLLLGLIRESDSVAARVLDKLGVALGRIRVEIERQVNRVDGRLGQDMQLTPRAKRVIDLAYDEARQQCNNYIGTEHLLLGLVREEEGLAGRVLTKLGVTLDQARDVVAQFQDSDPKLKERIRADSPVQRIIVEDPQGWRKRSLVTLFDVSPAQFNDVLDVAQRLKALDLERKMLIGWQYPRTMAMMFEKPSLRTRVSFEASMAHLRGHAINLSPAEIGLGTRESVPDVACVLSRWVDIITARVFKHETVEELAKHATIPVINALSDREHPIQAFADLMTLKEKKGELGNNLKLTYVGDGNNVLHALLLACAKTGVNISAACPDSYQPDAGYVTEAERIGKETGSVISVLSDRSAALKDADAVYTDVWASMGQEDEKAERAKIFAPYQINSELVKQAKPDAIVMHCLPAHREEEISSEIMDIHGDTIYEQAENRLHTQKALIALMIGL
jgi:ornithine carbamoyltransferase